MKRNQENAGDQNGSLTPMAWDVHACAKAISRTERAVYLLVSKRRIPFHKPDGRLQFIPEEIRAWLTQGAKKHVS